MHAKLFVLKSVHVVNEETVQELEWLLKAARDGKLDGVAYAAIHKGGAVSCNVSGRARLIPLFTLGAVETLKGLVNSLVR